MSALLRSCQKCAKSVPLFQNVSLFRGSIAEKRLRDAEIIG
jgi:hypothetical protein